MTNQEATEQTARLKSKGYEVRHRIFDRVTLDRRSYQEIALAVPVPMYSFVQLETVSEVDLFLSLGVPVVEWTSSIA